MLAGRSNLKTVLTDRQVLTCTLRERQVVQTQIQIILQHLKVPLRLQRVYIRKHTETVYSALQCSPQPVIVCVLASVVLPSALPSAPFKILNLANTVAK